MTNKNPKISIPKFTNTPHLCLEHEKEARAPDGVPTGLFFRGSRADRNNICGAQGFGFRV